MGLIGRWNRTQVAILQVRRLNHYTTLLRAGTTPHESVVADLAAISKGGLFDPPGWWVRGYVELGDEPIRWPVR